ncbi:MAG: hypothetical protein HY746_03185 [Elusimicrobia bacterium]|nr:hypothetical protein [Elusimicrobiota bacterium]
MDIFFRLRVLFWALIIILWGVFMYQYIRKDLDTTPATHISQNPFAKIKPDIPQVPRQPVVQPAPTQQGSVGQAAPDAMPHRILIKPLDAEKIKEIPSERIPEHSAEEKIGVSRPLKDAGKHPAAPPGFAPTETRHFIIYHEIVEASEKIRNSMELLHGNIMLDLVAFSPWTRDKKIFVYLCTSQETYQKLTGRPVWSGGAASLIERKIYLYESEEAFGILAHEMTHVYFDGFFTAQIPSPLWLSEGLATFVQTERGLAPPAWLKENLEMLKKGGGFKLADLTRIENLHDADEDSIRLWYSQSYSLVKFLMRLKQGDAFYQFCKNLKEGQALNQALFRAYGMPYNKISSLEYVWRHDLKTGEISNQSPY